MPSKSAKPYQHETSAVIAIPMREISFRITKEQPGHVEARSLTPPLWVTAESREELEHEAREALIQRFGAAHVAYRVRVRGRGQIQGQPWRLGIALAGVA
jgi:hypothetical protein